MLNLFEADWWAANSEDILFKNGETRQSLLELGKSLLKFFYEDTNGAQLISVEHPFEVPLINPDSQEKLDLPLVGRIDLIEKGPVIVDFKTSAKRPDIKTVDSNLQITAYCYAYHFKTGRLPDLRMDYLVKTKTPKMEKINTSRNPNDFKKLFNLAREVLKGIKSNVFFANPSWRCGDCEYRQQCWMFNGGLLNPPGRQKKSQRFSAGFYYSLS